MFNKLKYKMYNLGIKKIKFTISPDHMVDCLDKGQVRKMKFHSGNLYNVKMIKMVMNESSSWHSPLYNGIYEMSADIQPLTFNQFLLLSK